MSDRPNGSTPNDDLVTSAQPSTTQAVETIGPYRLLQRVGEGGMGDVWLAEQTHPVRRQVALKIIKAGMDTAQVVARFEAERQALAVMDHPAIARVFDGGATPQGRPYFVMEYVRGEGITSYCNKHKLSVRHRIDLFLQVCDGVQHAHQKGIIHRDLKPSNIMVTVQDDRPVPKIIDFGVAKATTQSLTERTLHTELGVMIGTPEYMSPEQAEMSGLDVDTRTDVYALGVILYELLSGVLPFDSQTLREKTIDEIRRTIREIDPPRPSTRVTASSAKASSADQAANGATAGELRGDLDWITMRALEKDRTRRYGSASDFAADLRRHLGNLPVLATPPTAVYRVGKFVRRHSIGVAVAAFAAVLLIALAATMAAQARRIARERDRANVEAEAAKQVADFMAGLFKVSDPGEARGNTLTAREILDKGSRDIELQLSGQPRIQARLQSVIGDVYSSLGQYRAAEPLLRRALARQQAMLGPDHADTLSTMHALANVYWYEDRYADAEPLYVAVFERRRRLLGEEHAETLRTAFDLASLYTLQKRWDEANRLMLNTLTIQRRTLGDDHPDTLGSMNNLASFYWNRRRFAEAQPLYLKAVEVSRRVLGSDHPNTLETIHNLATNEEALGHRREAETLYSEALAGKRRVMGENHFRTTEDEASLGAMYRGQKRYAEAEPLLLAVHRASVATYGAQHARVRRAMIELAALYGAWGRPDKVAEWQVKAPPQPPVQEAAGR